VVDAVTLVSDLLDVDDEKTSYRLNDMLSPDNRKMVVTPKEIDLLIDRASRLISLSLNVALHKNVDVNLIEALM
jgi:spore protease